MNTANLIVLAISLALEICLIVLLFRRGVRRYFPVFSIYACCTAGIAAARLLTIAHYRAYFFVFWSSEALFLLLGLAALNEAFRWVYEGFFRLWWFRLVYYGVIAVVLAATIANALANPPVQAHPVVGLILEIGISVNLLQLGMAALFGALANPLGIGFVRYPFGIATGFAVSSMGPLVGYLARSVFGTKADIFTQYASAVAYILALAVWVATFAWPEPKGPAWTPPMPPEEMLRIVRGYLGAIGVRTKIEIERKDDEP